MGASPSVPGDACAHERVEIIDSRFFGHGYSTPASRRIFCDVCRMQRWLDVEVALAQSQAEMGLIPREAADEITRAARLERIDLEEVRQGIRRTEHSLVSLLGAVQAICPGGTGEFLHYGATTQDVLDTAEVLEMRDVLDEVEREVNALLRTLVELARAHRNTLMIGRTHFRPALPTTFGLKVAGWIDELLRQAERLQAMRPRVLVAELFGGVGTMAAFDSAGRELLQRFALRLSLNAPVVAWHVARDRVAEYIAILAMLVATLARIAEEVRVLSRPEFGELEEGWRYGRVGSSTMPHKRNPEALEQVVVLARLARAKVPLGLEDMIQEHERDGRGTRLEWVAVPDVSHHALAALAILRPLLDGLQVHEDHMAEQARRAAQDICSERLMLALGRAVGKQTAHALVYEVSQNAQDEGRSLREVLSGRDDVLIHLRGEQLDDIFDPSGYLGSATGMVDQAISYAERWLADEQVDKVQE